MLRSVLRRYGLSDSDSEDAAQEIMLKIISLGDALPDIDKPAAYLTRAARNRAIDELRRRRRGGEDIELTPVLAERLPAHDDRIAALLADTVTAEVVRQAMRSAVLAHDHLVLRVVSSWLDVADELGEAPVSRHVAERAGVSHTSVNQALRRFRQYFPDDVVQR